MRTHFELTNDTTTYEGHTLHRIRATVNIPKQSIKKGDLGGFIESTYNLRHSVWVADNAIVCGKAIVGGNARVSDNAIVCGNAAVNGNAIVRDDAWVAGDTLVFGDAVVQGDTAVTEGVAFGY